MAALPQVLGTPLPPRSIGIFDLAENREVIYGAQLVTGKILSPKELALSMGFRSSGTVLLIGNSGSRLSEHVENLFLWKSGGQDESGGRT
jgi:hypothetical protein